MIDTTIQQSEKRAKDKEEEELPQKLEIPPKVSMRLRKVREL